MQEQRKICDVVLTDLSPKWKGRNASLYDSGPGKTRGNGCSAGIFKNNTGW